MPFDLSQVLFIATANNLQTVPAPLLDRMEIITVPGYTQDEKAHIASIHLVSTQFLVNLEEYFFRDKSLVTMINRYIVYLKNAIFQSKMYQFINKFVCVVFTSSLINDTT